MDATSVAAARRAVNCPSQSPMPHRSRSTAPEPWIVAHGGCAPARGTVLDVACGGGRHSLWFLQRGHPVLAVDRDADALAGLPGRAGLTALCTDLERQAWPLPGRQFAAVVMVNYLWRPLLPTLVASVAPGGVLIIDTFASGQEQLGRPRNPQFLLRPGELLEAVRGALEVHAYEYGRVPRGDDRIAVRQRICARRRP